MGKRVGEHEVQPHTPVRSNPTTTTATSDQPTFVLKKWQAVAMWSWAISVDTCAICRNPLSEPSLEWQAGNETDQGVQIAWGTCGHVFHLDCIGKWLKTRNFCPLCNQEWDFAKVEKIGGYDTGDKA